jgi:hypothetical protein
MQQEQGEDGIFFSVPLLSFIYLFIFAAPGLELTASHLLDRRSTT